MTEPWECPLCGWINKYYPKGGSCESCDKIVITVDDKIGIKLKRIGPVCPSCGFINNTKGHPILCKRCEKALVVEA